MGTYAAPAGLAGVGIGTGLNAFGQAQGLDAMRDVWRGQDQAQAGFNQQLAAKTNELIGGLDLNRILGGQAAQQRQSQLDAGSRNAASAAQKVAGRRTAGARSGAESNARAAQAVQTTLARALQDGRVQAILAGLQQGGQHTDMLGRRFGIDAGNIRRDAQAWAGLAPMQEQAAGMTGGWARQIGGLFNTLGQGAMMYGMMQPGGNQTAGGQPDVRMGGGDSYFNQFATDAGMAPGQRMPVVGDFGVQPFTPVA